MISFSGCGKKDEGSKKDAGSETTQNDTAADDKSSEKK